jgi:hypothetical protein
MRLQNGPLVLGEKPLELQIPEHYSLYTNYILLDLLPKLSANMSKYI